MPSPYIELLEHGEPWTGDLEPEDVRFMAEDLRSEFEISRRLTGDGYEVSASSFVGVVPLPSGGLLRCDPKVPVASVLWMLARTRRIPRVFPDRVPAFQKIDELLEWTVRYFVELMEEQIRAGLFRSYVEIEDNLPFVRGRIVFTEDLRRNAVMRQRAFCRYAELSWDIPENQIVRYVVRLLRGWGFNRELAARLDGLDAILDIVSLRPFTASEVHRMRYHRANDQYRTAHALCALFLERASLSERPGTWQAPAFLIDMNKLFEDFITESLRGRLLRVGLRLDAQETFTIASSPRFAIRPDLLVRSRGIVGDCKYRGFSTEVSNDHVYQVVTYASALRLSRAMLIYPASSAGERADLFQVGNPPIEVVRVAIDLAVSPQAIEDACDRLATVVAETPQFLAMAG